MNKRKRKTLFDIIAPFYGLFYKKQRENFIKVIRRAENDLDISSYETILDVGCGPGALCSVLNEKGLRVTGIDSAAKMLNIAKKRAENTGVQFL
ncbi:MAG: class I SAM-dependent methyltransferase, partial [Clostridiales bacterium]|nr:class I SAM-dependent methyltransferase [Clostridiales bacterium]